MKGESQMIRVVAAVVARDGGLLVCRRPPNKRHGGLFEFPGGKVATGETRAAALSRELLEELGLTALQVGKVLFSARDPGTPFAIDFVEVEARGEPSPREHTDVRWCRPEDLTALPLAPADACFARFLQSRG